MKPDFPSLADVIAKPRLDVNIKVAALKSINTILFLINNLPVNNFLHTCSVLSTNEMCYLMR